jgi:hypothetical protein
VVFDIAARILDVSGMPKFREICPVWSSERANRVCWAISHGKKRLESKFGRLQEKLSLAPASVRR